MWLSKKKRGVNIYLAYSKTISPRVTKRGFTMLPHPAQSSLITSARQGYTGRELQSRHLGHKENIY